MSKYKLTTDLIKDCMALIPENIDLLNENQNLFDFSKYPKNFLKINFQFMLEVWQFFIISHCLRTIPEFQSQIERYADLHMHANNQKIRHTIKELQLMNELLCLIPKTIASATLHGQGEFPPSTLQELCESYKNVMSK